MDKMGNNRLRKLFNLDFVMKDETSFLGKHPLVASLAFAIFGLSILYFNSANLTPSVLSYHKYNQQAEGVIVDRVEVSKTCHSTAEFEYDGLTYQAFYDGCPKVGTPVKVRYDTYMTLKPTANGPLRVYLVKLPLALFFFITGGIAWLISYRKFQQWQRSKA